MKDTDGDCTADIHDPDDDNDGSPDDKDPDDDGDGIPDHKVGRLGVGRTLTPAGGGKCRRASRVARAASRGGRGASAALRVA